MQFDSPVKDLGAFRLKQERAFPERAVAALIHLDAVDEVGDVAALANCFKAVPGAMRFFGVVATAEAKYGLPGRIDTAPRDPSHRKFGGLSGGIPDARAGLNVYGESWRR